VAAIKDQRGGFERDQPGRKGLAHWDLPEQKHLIAKQKLRKAQGPMHNPDSLKIWD
jgi:hypothetical protein